MFYVCSPAALILMSTLMILTNIEQHRLFGLYVIQVHQNQDFNTGMGAGLRIALGV